MTVQQSGHPEGEVLGNPPHNPVVINGHQTLAMWTVRVIGTDIPPLNPVVGTQAVSSAEPHITERILGGVEHGVGGYTVLFTIGLDMVLLGKGKGAN